MNAVLLVVRAGYCTSLNGCKTWQEETLSGGISLDLCIEQEYLNVCFARFFLKNISTVLIPHSKNCWPMDHKKRMQGKKCFCKLEMQGVRQFM